MSSLIKIIEGRTEIYIPLQDENSRFPPGTGEVFFNRRMRLNRDATILLLPLLLVSDYLDGMAASGVRGIRVAHECGIPVTINDKDPKALELISHNVSHSALPIEITRADINSLLSERSFDVVDLDPFGSPVPFLDAGVRGTRRFLFVTATDTAPLCGAHIKAGIRRYNAHPLNTDYHGEVGLRILLGYVARVAARYDRGIQPLFCFSREHFIRLHLRLLSGTRAADHTLKRLGFILHCPHCQYRREDEGFFPTSGSCPHCKSDLIPIGPLWRGEISHLPILTAMLSQIPESHLDSKDELTKILTTCRDELPTSSFYDYHQIAKSIKVAPPEINVVREGILKKGYAFSRTHFSGYGIKTDAPLEVIRDVISQGSSAQ